METIDKREIAKRLTELKAGLDTGKGYIDLTGSNAPERRRDLQQELVKPFNKRYALTCRLRTSRVHMGPHADTYCYMREFIAGDHRYQLTEFLFEGLTQTVVLERPHPDDATKPALLTVINGPHAYILAETALVDHIKG